MGLSILCTQYTVNSHLSTLNGTSSVMLGNVHPCGCAKYDVMENYMQELLHA